MHEVKKGKRVDWNTPLSQCKNISLKSLIDNGETLEVTFDSDSSSYCFCWTEFLAYRNTLEVFSNPWDWDPDDQPRSGCTNMVKDSLWLVRMQTDSDLADVIETVYKGVNHYVIGSCKYTTEILSNKEPEIFLCECCTS